MRRREKSIILIIIYNYEWSYDHCVINKITIVPTVLPAAVFILGEYNKLRYVDISFDLIIQKNAFPSLQLLIRNLHIWSDVFLAFGQKLRLTDGFFYALSTLCSLFKANETYFNCKNIYFSGSEYFFNYRFSILFFLF